MFTRLTLSIECMSRREGAKADIWHARLLKPETLIRVIKMGAGVYSLTDPRLNSGGFPLSPNFALTSGCSPPTHPRPGQSICPWKYNDRYHVAQGLTSEVEVGYVHNVRCLSRR